MTAPEKDMLISRLVDGDASREDWRAFRALADADGELWRELAEAQRDQAELAQAVGAAVAVADLVEAPVMEHTREKFENRLRLAVRWGGWAVAAAMALAWVGGYMPATTTIGSGPVVPANILPSFGTASDAYKAYLSKGQEEGRVLGESPARVLVSKTPTADGKGFEVIYLRQILERSVVNDLYQFGYDESGQAVPVRIEEAPTGKGAI